MTLKRLFTAIALTCLLGFTTFAGDMQTPPCALGDMQTPPCQSVTGDIQSVTVDMDTPAAPSPDTVAVAVGVLREMLAIW